jgi:hypothetical protein
MSTTEEEARTEKSEIRRLGDLQKCPICGSQVDPDAYHCPYCHNYYCFHCRARLLGTDKQYQCVSKDCDYYGKLLCSVCDLEVRKDEPPAVYFEPEDGYWPLLLIGSLLLAILIWIMSSFVAGLLSWLVIFVGGAYILHRAGVNVFCRELEVARPRSSAYHTCICCQQPVRELRGARQ